MFRLQSMYSSSNAFLGGANSDRPNPLQYGQQSNLSQGQRQPNSFGQQPTGFNQTQIQSQYTGFPGQGPQQSQYNGIPMQFQGAPGPSKPPAPPQQLSQTSSQLAQSFQSIPTPTSTTPKSGSAGTKIPKIRLSFLTAQDQAKFEQLFKSAVGDGQSLDGILLYFIIFCPELTV